MDRWRRNALARHQQESPTPPRIHLVAVVSDRRYWGVNNLAVQSSINLLAIEFHGVSHKTRPGGIIYRYTLQGYDQSWQNTNTTRVEYQDLPAGDYEFEVYAVDRDLVYSESPAIVTLNVHIPYERIGWMSALGVAVLLVGWQTARIIMRDRKQGANTELFAANAEIRLQTERKSAFLASMSHELRTPMNAIKGFTSLVLRREKTLSDRGQENLKKATQASDHLLGMINDLLDLSKIEAGRMDVNSVQFDVKTLVTSACDTVSPLIQEGVELRQDVADDIGEANTDKARLQQMVINLLSNAIKFTENGMVTVTAQREQGGGRRKKENLTDSVRIQRPGVFLDTPLTYSRSKRRVHHEQGYQGIGWGGASESERRPSRSKRDFAGSFLREEEGRSRITCDAWREPRQRLSRSGSNGG